MFVSLEEFNIVIIFCRVVATKYGLKFSPSNAMDIV